MAGLCGIFHSGELVLFSGDCYIAAVLLGLSVAQYGSLIDDPQDFLFPLFKILTDINEFASKHGGGETIELKNPAFFISLTLDCAADEASKDSQA